MVVTRNVNDIEILTRQQNNHQLQAHLQDDVKGVRNDIAQQETMQETNQTKCAKIALERVDGREMHMERDRPHPKRYETELTKRSQRSTRMW